MLLKLNSPRGVQEIYPPRSIYFQRVYTIISEILNRYNFQFLILPTLEYEKNFNLLNGDDVHREMYRFKDRSDRDLVLRPEGTISLARLVCNNKLVTSFYTKKFYYWSNMFRYERPQKGRYREFWQLGVEMIGVSGVHSDFFLLKLANEVLRLLGIKQFEFKLNYFGSVETQIKYKEKLVESLTKQKTLLCEYCKERLKGNPLRIIDCKECKDKLNFPLYNSIWTSEDNNYVNLLNEFLDKENIKYHYDYSLVRGLDYYTGLVYEVYCDKFDKSLLGGGRYDNLYNMISDNNNSFASVGWAIGLDRLINILQEYDLLSIPNLDIFFLVNRITDYSLMNYWQNKLSYLTIDYNLKINNKFKLKEIVKQYNPKLIIIFPLSNEDKNIIIIKDLINKKTIYSSIDKIIDWINAFFKHNE